MLAGMTGLMRRETCTFLWVCVMGINNSVDPDDDPLLQTALELDYINGELLRTNEDVDCMHRT